MHKSVDTSTLLCYTYGERRKNLQVRVNISRRIKCWTKGETPRKHFRFDRLINGFFVRDETLSFSGAEKGNFMNNVALNHRLSSIRSTAVPLHERKARENPNGESFNAIMARKAQKMQKADPAPATPIDTTPVTSIYTPLATATTTTATTSSELNTSLKWYDHKELDNLCPKEDAEEYNRYINDFIAETRARNNGMARIHLGAGELPKFMEELQKVAESGGCLTAFLQKFIPEPVKDRTAVNWHDVKLPTQGVDVIRINPETGEIVHAQHFQPLGLRFLSGQGNSFMDREAQNDFVWDLAYDLHEFIQTAFFREKDDCFNEIDRLLEEIKARQADKCMARFNSTARFPSSSEIWFN
jgi:hypothetical protein